jgi:hypothetical protein
MIIAAGILALGLLTGGLLILRAAWSIYRLSRRSRLAQPLAMAFLGWCLVLTVLLGRSAAELGHWCLTQFQADRIASPERSVTEHGPER